MLNTTVRFDRQVILEMLCFSKRNTQVFSLAYGIHKARAKLGCFFNWLNNPSVS